MPSFASINESMLSLKAEKQKNKDQDIESLIARGIDIGGEDFWEDLIRVLGDGRGFSALLEINEQKIATWRGKIRNALTKYTNTEEDFPEKPTKRRLVNHDDYEGDL